MIDDDEKRSLVNVSCELDPRSVSPLRCLSAYRSWAAQTSSSSTRALRSTALTTKMGSCQSSYYPGCARYREFFVFQQDNAPAHRHVTLCDFRRSFHRLFGQQTALTLIRLITGSGASFNSEWTSCGCTTLTNWNSVCSKCGVTSTRASLTMQLTSGMHAGERWTLRAYAVENNNAYLQSTVWQHKRFIFVNYDTLSDFFLL